MYASAVTSRISAVRAESINNDASRKTSIKKYFEYGISSVSDLLDVLLKANNVELGILELSNLAKNIKCVCTTPLAISKLVDVIYEYSTISRTNAHNGAVLCTYLNDINLSELNFRTAMLQKMQVPYDRRNVNYHDLDSFLQQVVFLCEVYHHLKIGNSVQYECLVMAMYKYFIMLLTGGSEKEIIVFCELFVKCYDKMKCDYPVEFHELLLKMRKLIVSESSSVVTRSILLHSLEKVLTYNAPLTVKAQTFYKIFVKPTFGICP